MAGLHVRNTLGRVHSLARRRVARVERMRRRYNSSSITIQYYSTVQQVVDSPTPTVAVVCSVVCWCLVSPHRTVLVANSDGARTSDSLLSASRKGCYFSAMVRSSTTDSLVYFSLLRSRPAMYHDSMIATCSWHITTVFGDWLHTKISVACAHHASAVLKRNPWSQCSISVPLLCRLPCLVFFVPLSSTLLCQI